MRIRSLLVLLALTATTWAQEGPKSPKELFETFFAETKRYIRQDDNEALQRAGRLFDLSDRTTDKDEVGMQAAKDLLNFLNRLEAPVPTNDPSVIPGAEIESALFIYATPPHGNIICIRVEGAWRFSKETRKEAADLYARVADREAKIGQGAVNDTATWIRDRMPDWMLRRPFLLQNWQWLGLLILIFIGLVAGLLARTVMGRVGGRIAQGKGVTLRPGKKTGRPFALFATAVMWWLGLRFLGLRENVYDALMLATRLVLMVSVVWSLSRVVDWVSEIFAGVARRTDNRLDDLLVPMVRKALKVFIVVLGIVWIADNLGMDIAALLAGLGIGGIAIALASKDTVENFFGAVAILADRPFQVGDWIRMNDIEGSVEEVGFRTTRVRTFYNSLITFPNAMLIRSSVDNLGEREYRRVKMTIGITYDTPADKVAAFVEGIRELVRLHPYTRKDYYHVYFHGFGDSSLDILLYLFLKTPGWPTELRERQRLMMDILRLAQKMGVEFAFPTRTMHMVPSEMPEHEGFRDVPEAHRSGRRLARGIVEEFTGPGVPPPVVIGDRPDDAEGSGGGE